MLRDKRIVLCVSGGIAVYKSLELLRLLKKAGADVHVVMSSSAQEFVTALSFQTLSGNPVHTELFNLIAEREIGHISLADRADLFLIVPATANIIGKIANGIADDMLSTTVMATKAPVLIAPAMNVNMFTNPIYRENEEKLRRFGYLFVPPVNGPLACGWEGEGKLAAVETIFEAAVSALTKKDLAGKTIMVTAGPTREEIDPVRYISNHSSGKMGYALARNAARRGARVILVSGPVNLLPPCGVELFAVENARQMLDVVMANVGECDAVIKAAAVADYRPEERKATKIKKQAGSMTIDLVKNPDILLELGRMERRPLLVGFAAETCSLESYASAKLVDKNLDMIVANDVSQADAGFNVENNRAILIYRDGRTIDFELMSKDKLSEQILNIVFDELQRRKG